MLASPRVLHIIHSGAFGGGPRVVMDLMTHLPGEHVLATSDDGPLLGWAANEGFGTHRLPFAGELSFAASLPMLIPWCRAVDLVHLHGQFAGFYGALAARAARRRSIYTAHFPSFLTDWNWHNRIRNRVAEAVPCRSAALTVTCSRSMEGEYVERKLVSRGRILTIYNGVAEVSPDGTQQAILDALGIDRNRPVVLAMGRFTDQKGFDLLLSAMPAVLRKVPSAVLLLAGDGELRAQLEGLAAHLDIEANVRFLGFRDDTADLLSIASVVAVPSRYDVFPLVPLEAMMAGHPLVATDLPSLREAVLPGETGLLTAPEPGALACALGSLLADPARAGAMGARGQERARRRFSVERMARDYQSAYTTVLEGSA